MIFSVLSENISAFGALLVGVAAVSSSLLTLRGSRKRGRDECDQRIEDIKEAFRAGIRYEERDEVSRRRKQAS